MDYYLSTAYLAPIEYYGTLAKGEVIYLEQHENYTKQTYRNRCNIAGGNGLIALTIPVDKGTSGKTLIRDIRISGHNEWQIQHWRAIESAYNSSPFFEYYKDDLWPFYNKKWNFLWDLNWEIQLKILELLQLNPHIRFTENYKAPLDENETDLRDLIHPKKEISSIMKPYYQVFENQLGFIPNLSIIDLLFNMGNESIFILE